MNMSFMPFSALGTLPALGGDSSSPAGSLPGQGGDFQSSLMGQLQLLADGYPDPARTMPLEALLEQDPEAMALMPQWLAQLMDQADLTLEDLQQEGADAALASLLITWQQLAETGRGLPGVAGESLNPGAERRLDGGGLTALTAALNQVLHGQGTGSAQAEGNPVMPQALHALVVRLGADAAGVGRDSAAPLTPMAAETVPAGQVQAQSLVPNSPLRALDLDVPMTRPNWGQAVGSRVLWMVNQNMQGAELRLNPPHLGPLEVRISMEGDRANIQFLAHHPQAREALDAAMPRLREMFSESGLLLGDVDVSGRDTGGQGGPAQESVGTRPEDRDGSDQTAAEVVSMDPDERDGAILLDAYA
ncbi:flagellar hook-length control protein FliK [Ectothiorhodospira lacustris]|uniref:flagellar hook-length control protein FliK n=1 Tax=Ectothiorhodospira lacustris TaxID=2899127 RepID=UPI001EE8005A|nr:flagellar hook-length control protein FliK [Ectothiorhodospira lacustris]MCG5499525.1 flagellar hook-length control protein FliK [Ectothiorhodospira lacustris]